MKFRNKGQFFDVVIVGLVWRWGFSLHDHAGIERRSLEENGV